MPSATIAADTAYTLAVSVVVPTCGQLDLLDRCLDALTRQTLPGSRYELIIVDDEPDHNTLHLVAGWRSRTCGRGPRLVYTPNAGPHGPAAARNRGWRAAQAAIVAFTDDDTVPAPDWLASGLAAFAAHIDCLCGKIDMPLPAVPTDYQRNARLLQCAEFAAANCFCRKGVLERLGGFDERFTSPWREDSDLHFRLLKMNATIAHAPQALVVHPLRPAPWGVSLLQTKKVAFDALLYKKHPELYRQKIHPEPHWNLYATVVSLLAVLAGLVGELEWMAVMGAGAWAMLTVCLCARRLSGTAKTPSHVVEMIVTSALIPPLAVFWWIVGAVRYRVRFA